jgi:hypothetical protein
VEIVCRPSAFKHGIDEADIRKAFDLCQLNRAMPDGAGKYLLIGFDRNGNLLELPASLKMIERMAFYYCVNLFNLNIPDSLTSIKWENGGMYGVFSDCGKLPIKTRQRLKELGYTGGF